MKNNLSLVLLILSIIGVMLSMASCTEEVIIGTEVADLIPVNPEGWAGFCDLVDYTGPSYYGRHLRVHIKNDGLTDAGESWLVVDFGNSNTIAKTPVIPVGAVKSIIVQLPDDFCKPDCTFTIIADYYDDIFESDIGEANNAVMGTCMGVW
jgi:hypothetical protein